MMLHTKYQDSRPCGFRHKEFFMFSLNKPVKHMTPGWRGGGGGLAHLWPQRYNLIKLCRGPLDDATYQNIKALGLLVSDKNIFKFSS